MRLTCALGCLPGDLRADVGLGGSVAREAWTARLWTGWLAVAGADAACSAVDGRSMRVADRRVAAGDLVLRAGGKPGQRRGGCRSEPDERVGRAPWCSCQSPRFRNQSAWRFARLMLRLM